MKHRNVPFSQPVSVSKCLSSCSKDTFLHHNLNCQSFYLLSKETVNRFNVGVRISYVGINGMLVLVSNVICPKGIFKSNFYYKLFSSYVLQTVMETEVYYSYTFKFLNCPLIGCAILYI